MISAFLDRIRQQNDIQILYANESGSRAWGFPSSDSDYDVRFLYLRPISWYISIQDRKDTIELMEGKLLDGSGWDLRKALKLAYSGNTTLFEWLQSPMVYHDESGFRDRLWATIQPYFNPRSAMHHYLGLAEGIVRREWTGEEVNVKRYFYVLRPVLAAHWILAHHSPPPVEFEQLMPLLPDYLRPTVEELLALKRRVLEADSTPRLPELESYLSDRIDSGRADAARLERGAVDAAPLNQFLRNELGLA